MVVDVDAVEAANVAVVAANVALVVVASAGLSYGLESHEFALALVWAEIEPAMFVNYLRLVEDACGEKSLHFAIVSKKGDETAALQSQVVHKSTEVEGALRVLQNRWTVAAVVVK